MTQLGTLGMNFILRQGWTRASLMLASLFLLSSVQAQQSLPSRQSKPDSERRLHEALRVRPQSPRGVSQGAMAPPQGWRNHSAAEAHASRDTTPMPLFHLIEVPQYPTGQEPTSVAIADVNGDGKPDIAVTNSLDNTVTLLLGNGDGTFQPHLDYPTGDLPADVAVADFNGDGKPDLVVANAKFLESTVSVLLGNGDGTFQPRIDYVIGADLGLANVYFVVAADFNGDGKQDLAVRGDGDMLVTFLVVLLGNGDGTFQIPVIHQMAMRGGALMAGEPNSRGSVQSAMENTDGNSHGPIAVGDLDGDGNPDLVATGHFSGVSVILGNGDGTFRDGGSYDTGLYPVSVAVADFDGDGRPDLVIANTGDNTLSVLINNGNGTFKVKVDYPTDINPDCVAAGDFNGDNKPDVAVSSENNAVSVLLGNGDGTFQDYLDYTSRNGLGAPIALADFNVDGKPDLTIVNYQRNSVSVLLGNGDGTFPANVAYATGRSPQWFAAGYFNGDDKLDLVTANLSGSGVSVLLGNGDGTYQAHMDYSSVDGQLSGAAGDFNSDGKTDLAVTNGETLKVMLNNGDGTFQAPVDYMTGGEAKSLTFGDFNGDGKTDLAVATYLNSVGVLLGNGDGTFQAHTDYPTDYFPVFVTAGDFNGDSKPDLAITEGVGFDSGVVSVLLGNGNGTFQAHLDSPIAYYPVAVTVGDFNSDGKLDLAVTEGAFPDGVVSVLLGNGDGTFQALVDYPTGLSASSVAAADFDGDGKLDLVVANAGDGTVSVLLGNGDGTFKASMNYASGPWYSAVAVGDVNNDEAPDVAVLTQGNAIAILLNIRGTVASLKSSVNPWMLDQSLTLTSNFRASLNETGSAVPTGTVSFSDGTTALGTQTLGADGVAALAISALNPGTHNITAAYGGDANFNPHTVALTEVVIGPDFGLAAAPGKATLKSGSSAVFSITASSTLGFNGAVSLMCSVSPTPTLAPTCSLNPESVAPAANGSATSSLTVATTAPSVALSSPMFGFRWRALYALWLPVCGMVVLGIGFSRSPGERQGKIVAVLLISLVCTILGAQIACGGSDNQTHRERGGTPAGTYTISVNAASGTLSHTTQVTITVQ